MRRLKEFDEALVAGEWFNHTKGTKVFADIAIGVGLAISAGASIYATTTQAGIANQQLALEQTQNQRQNTAFSQLQQLIQNPGSFFNNPVFTSALGIGEAGAAHANAASFGGASTSESENLLTYGQGFAANQLLSQEQLLAGMSGTGFNPASAGSAASGAASSAAAGGASLGGLLAYFGTSGTASSLFGSGSSANIGPAVAGGN